MPVGMDLAGIDACKLFRDGVMVRGGIVVVRAGDGAAAGPVATVLFNLSSSIVLSLSGMAPICL
jgi:hypothetical protein